MTGQKIVNMHITSDRADELGLLHLSSFRPEAIGSVETFDGKQYRVINNWQLNYVVTYELVRDEA